jgi:hypothetical protein
VAGRDYGTSIEIVSGLKGNESVIESPPDSIVTGEQVRIKGPTQTTPQAPAGATQ